MVLIEDDEGNKCAVSAYLHPRGCMGARQTHIDLKHVENCKMMDVFTEVGFHGAELPCYSISDCIVLDLSSYGAPGVTLCINGVKINCASIVYVKRLPRKGIYIGPIIVEMMY